MASGSCRDRKELSQRRNVFSLLEPIRDHPKSQCLHSRNGLLSSLSISHHTGKIEDLTDPTAVLFPVNFDEKIHGSVDP
jgi:hypothetical protein